MIGLNGVDGFKAGRNIPHCKSEQTGDTLAIKKNTWVLAILLLSLGAPVAAQDKDSSTAPQQSSPVSKGADFLFDYLDMAGTKTAQDFRPLSGKERTKLYLESMVNPLGYIKVGLSAGIDQREDNPEEWGQGASGYGKRFGDILGQYGIQRTVRFGVASALHEDNRYFNSGKQGIWPRTGYAVASGILARHDDGRRRVAISQIGGVAAGAFLSRLWQPPSRSSAGDGAVSFGVTMGTNIGFGVGKEFLPDLARAIFHRRKKTP